MEEALDVDGGGVIVLDVLVIAGLGLWGRRVGMMVDGQLERLGGGLILGAVCGETGSGWHFSNCSKMYERIFSLCLLDLLFFLFRLSDSVSDATWDKMITSISLSIFSFLMEGEGRQGSGVAIRALDTVSPGDLGAFNCDKVVSTNMWPALERMLMWLGSGLGERYVLEFIGFSTLKSR